MNMVIAEKEFESDSANRVMMTLLKDFNPSDVRVRYDEEGFVFLVLDDIIPIPEFSKMDKTVIVSSDTYKRLQKCKSHPDESLNTTIFKLIEFKNTKVDPNQKMKKKMTKALGQYGIYFEYAKKEELPELHKLYKKICNTSNTNNYDVFYAALTELQGMAERIFNHNGSISQQHIAEYKRAIKEHLN